MVGFITSETKWFSTFLRGSFLNLSFSCFLVFEYFWHLWFNRSCLRWVLDLLLPLLDAMAAVDCCDGCSTPMADLPLPDICVQDAAATPTHTHRMPYQCYAPDYSAAVHCEQD
jgi:hypothetical protein